MCRNRIGGASARCEHGRFVGGGGGMEGAFGCVIISPFLANTLFVGRHG